MIYLKDTVDISKSTVAISILFILYVVTFKINLALIIDSKVSYFNFFATVFYLLAWTGYGIYIYKKKELTFFLYTLAYWILVMAASIIPNILFFIIFFTPLCGLRIFFVGLNHPNNLVFQKEPYAYLFISIIFITLSVLAIIVINNTRSDKKW